jgi:hypothetical protein
LPPELTRIPQHVPLDFERALARLAVNRHEWNICVG